jgi:hypothetical protein
MKIKDLKIFATVMNPAMQKWLNSGFFWANEDELERSGI